MHQSSTRDLDGDFSGEHLMLMGWERQDFLEGFIQWTVSAFPLVIPKFHHPVHPWLGLAGSLSCWTEPGLGDFPSDTDIPGKEGAAGTYMQHWESGARMEISSWECRPNLGEKQSSEPALSFPRLPELLPCLTLWRCPGAAGSHRPQTW